MNPRPLERRQRGRICPPVELRGESSFAHHRLATINNKRVYVFGFLGCNLGADFAVDKANFPHLFLPMSSYRREASLESGRKASAGKSGAVPIDSG